MVINFRFPFVLRILLKFFLLLLLLIITTYPALATHLSQDGDPVSHCAAGVKLFYEGNSERALPLLEAGFNNRTEANFVNKNDLGECALALGSIYLSTDQYTKALTLYFAALDFTDNDNQELKGAVLNSIGTAYLYQGKYAEAQEYYQRALVILRDAGDKVGEGRTLSGLGMVFHSQGQSEKALEYFQQALAIAQEAGDRSGVGGNLHNIGGVHDAQGQYAKALKYYQQALEIWRRVGERSAEGKTLNNIGLVYDSQGQLEKALVYYQRALVIKRALGERGGEGTTLDNMGGVFLEKGQIALALEYYEKALAISREVENRSGEGAALNNIGQVYDSIGQYKEALEYYQQALAIWQEIGEQYSLSKTLQNIAGVYSSLDQDTKSLEYYQRVLKSVRDTGDRPEESTTLNNIGSFYASQGQYEKALEYFQQALSIMRELGDLSGESTALNNIGQMYEVQGQYATALEYYQRGIAKLETIRGSLGSEQSRTSFFAQHTYTFDHAIAVAIKQTLFEKAFTFSEQGRARAFLDSMSTGYVELSDTESVVLYTREQEAYELQESVRKALSKARSENPPDEQLISDLKTQLAQSKTDYQAALDAISERDSYLEQLIPGRSKVLDVPQAQALLDDQTTLLSFWVLDDQTLVFIVTRDTFNTIALPVSREDLYAKIKVFRDFSNTEVAQPESAVGLHQILIAPIKAHLVTHNLVIVPHGELHYLPFSALTDGKRYLIDDYSITYLPSVSAWLYIKQNIGKANTNPLVVGNPATDNPELQPLPFAEGEAKAIAGLYSVNPLIGESATESAVKKLVGQAGVLHLAAHGTYNTINPLYSAIYLVPDGQNDGLLEVHEIYGLDLNKTDLVILSACETQLGELSSGDELVGLTRAFLFAGTPTVGASLWEVNDKATEILMEKFYAYWKGGMGKAEALRQAQMDVMKEYPNPYYWAGFVLNGDGGESANIAQSDDNTFVNISIFLALCCCALSFIALTVVGIFFILKRK